MSGPALDFWTLWKPLPRQRQFLEASARYRYLLYGGSRGSAKSHLLRWGMLWKLLQWAQAGHRGVRVGLFSEDYPTLEDRQISKIQREFPPWLGHLGTTKADGLAFYVKPQYGGGVLTLRNLDDPAKYVGGEFAGVGIEELTRVQRSTFDMVRGSIRWPGLTDTFFWAVTNPLGVGLTWVRQLWIEREFPKELQALAHQFHFIRAFPTDNHYLTPDYWSELESQPDYVKRAWIDGDWYVPVGVMFSEVRPAIHQVPASPPGADSTLEIIGDWGYEHAAVALWIETTPEGRHRVYREFVTNHTDPVTWATEVVARTGERERITRFCIDSAANQQPQTGTTSPFEQMVTEVFFKAGIPSQLVAKRKADNRTSREHGWHLLHQYVRVDSSRRPQLVIGADCPVLWKQLTTIVRGEPPHSIEDTAPGQTDDALTALRYWAMMRGLPTPPGATPTPLYNENRHRGFDYGGRRTRKPWEHVAGEFDGAGTILESHPELRAMFAPWQGKVRMRHDPEKKSYVEDTGDAVTDWQGQPLRPIGDGEW